MHIVYYSLRSVHMLYSILIGALYINMSHSEDNNVALGSGVMCPTRMTDFDGGTSNRDSVDKHAPQSISMHLEFALHKL